MPLCLPEVNRHMVRFCRILTHERAAAQQAVRGHGAAGSAVDRRRRQSLSFAAPRLLASLRFDRNVLCRHCKKPATACRWRSTAWRRLWLRALQRARRPPVATTRRCAKPWRRRGARTPSFRSSLARCPRGSTPPSGGCASWSAERSEEHTSELQSLMRSSYAVFSLKKKKTKKKTKRHNDKKHTPYPALTNNPPHPYPPPIPTTTPPPHHNTPLPPPTPSPPPPPHTNAHPYTPTLSHTHTLTP